MANVQLLRPDIPAYQFGQPPASKEQAVHHAFIHMSVGRSNLPAAVSGVQKFRHGEHADSGAFHARQVLHAAGQQCGLGPEQAVCAFAIADALEAPQQGAQLGGGVVIVIHTFAVGVRGMSGHRGFLSMEQKGHRARRVADGAWLQARMTVSS